MRQWNAARRAPPSDIIWCRSCERWRVARPYSVLCAECTGDRDEHTGEMARPRR